MSVISFERKKEKKTFNAYFRVGVSFCPPISSLTSPLSSLALSLVGVPTHTLCLSLVFIGTFGFVCMVLGLKLRVRKMLSIFSTPELHLHPYLEVFWGSYIATNLEMNTTFIVKVNKQLAEEEEVWCYLAWKCRIKVLRSNSKLYQALPCRYLALQDNLVR